jgi:hypothetical protein
MPNINVPVNDEIARRKKRTKKTWPQIIRRGIEAFEYDKRNPLSVKQGNNHAS